MELQLVLLTSVVTAILGAFFYSKFSRAGLGVVIGLAFIWVPVLARLWGALDPFAITNSVVGIIFIIASLGYIGYKTPARRQI